MQREERYMGEKTNQFVGFCFVLVFFMSPFRQALLAEHHNHLGSS